MEIITENYVFQNVMPWVGIWFSAMTIIFLFLVIHRFLREKFWIKSADYGVGRTIELSTIISFVPLFLMWCLLGVIDLLMRKISKAPKQN